MRGLRKVVQNWTQDKGEGFERKIISVKTIYIWQKMQKLRFFKLIDSKFIISQDFRMLGGRIRFQNFGQIPIGGGKGAEIYNFSQTFSMYGPYCKIKYLIILSLSGHHRLKNLI